MNEEREAIRKRATRPGVRNLILGVAAPPLLILLLLTLFHLFSHEEPTWILALLMVAGIVPTLWMSILAIRKFSERVNILEDQRDAFFQELMRLSKVASLGEVSSSIAHDLNNPLAILNEEAGWMQDLMNKSDTDENSRRLEFTDSIEQILIQVDRARGITKRVLNWARDTEESSGLIDVNLLLNKTLFLVERDMERVKVKVAKRMDPELPPIRGNIAELRQVFLNLMKNALDALPDDGGVLSIKTRSSVQEVCVSIADTGTGISQEVLPHIFEPFFTTKPEGKGTGLGLSICSWIARKNSGRIEVESTPGSGTTFHVCFPIAIQTEGRIA